MPSSYLYSAVSAGTLLLLLGGCDGGTDAPIGEAAPAAEAVPAEEDDQNLAPIPQPAGENAVGVRIHEYEIGLTRDTVPAGRLRFHVLNAGTTSHMFIVRNSDVYEATPHLVPGDSTVLEAELEPGEYNVLCAVRDEFDHISEGERRSLVVR